MTTLWPTKGTINCHDKNLILNLIFIYLLSFLFFFFLNYRSLDLHWAAFNWDLHFRWLTLTGPLLAERRKNMIEPFKTPAMAGGLFSMDKNYFFKLGSYDEKMKIWGGENIELSLRVWQCGGSIEIAPCSHVGHLFRKSSPHTFPEGVGEVLYGNLARVALVWMDEWAEFYFKFHPGIFYLFKFSNT